MRIEILCLLHFCRPGFRTLHIPPWSSKELTSASHMSLPEAGYGSEEGYVGSEISGAVSGVTTPGASRLQASQLQQRSTTMQRLHWVCVVCSVCVLLGVRCVRICIRLIPLSHFLLVFLDSVVCNFSGLVCLVAVAFLCLRRTHTTQFWCFCFLLFDSCLVVVWWCLFSGPYYYFCGFLWSTVG